MACVMCIYVGLVGLKAEMLKVWCWFDASTCLEAMGLKSNLCVRVQCIYMPRDQRPRRINAGEGGCLQSPPYARRPEAPADSSGWGYTPTASD